MNRFEPVTEIDGSCVVLKKDHVDTDQIIPARFLYRSRQEGFEGLLFHDFVDKTIDFSRCFSKRASIENNRPNVLLAGDNFGCGSSREHAVWALLDNGFHAVIAKSFGDIFYANAGNNGLLLVAIEDRWAELVSHIELDPKLNISLPEQRVRTANGTEFGFEVDPFFKKMLEQGMQEMDITLSLSEKIQNFEAQQMARSPWLQRPSKFISPRETK